MEIKNSRSDEANKSLVNKTTSMTKRQKVRSQIAAKRNEICKLEKEITELVKQDILISDKLQRFTETEQDYVVSRKPKVVEKRTVGVVHWNETYYDEDTGKPFLIERSKVVRINGIWQLDRYDN